MAANTAKDPFKTDAERNTVLRALEKARQAMADAADALNASSDEMRDDKATAYDKAHTDVRALYNTYAEHLPTPAISRCPFTGSPFHYPIDTFGLNGPWWEYDRPARPSIRLPDTVFAVTGAVALKRSPPRTSFIVKPGPAVPTVVARLVVNPEIKAVVSSLKIGALDAYAIVYFAEFPPLDIARVNNWGMGYYLAENMFGEGYTASIPDLPLDFDTDLAFYIRTGRLMWIAPGDETLQLRSTLENCPYLDLPGRTHPVGLLNGESWNSLAADPVETADAP